MRRIAVHVGQRLGIGVFVLVGAATLTFFGLRLVPGDPAFAILGASNGGQSVNFSAAAVEAVRSAYHLDQPLWAQYLYDMRNLLTGQFGESYVQHTPVTHVIGAQIGPTLALTSLGTLLAIVLSLALAVCTSGRFVGSRVSSVVELWLASTPTFWLGFLLLLVFSYQLHLLPALSDGSFASLVLPALSLALPACAPLTQVLRTGLEDFRARPLHLSLRARGLGDFRIEVTHALRHAIIPYLTALGFTVGWMLGGAAVTETLFNRQGIGKLLVDSVTSQDMPVVIAIVLICTGVFVLVNLVIDLVYVLIDPEFGAEH